MAPVNESYAPTDGNMHHSWHESSNKVLREITEKGLYSFPEHI